MRRQVRIPVFPGISGSDTRKVAMAVDSAGHPSVDRYLVTCPCYTRPSQEGLFRHFEAVAGSTDRPVPIYNISYRTGVNIANETMLALAEITNIVGLKDCCADTEQSFDLLDRRPAGFSALTGEDAHFYSALAHGADGGILASAHVETARFAMASMIAIRKRLSLAGGRLQRCRVCYSRSPARRRSSIGSGGWV